MWQSNIFWFICFLLLTKWYIDYIFKYISISVLTPLTSSLYILLPSLLSLPQIHFCPSSPLLSSQITHTMVMTGWPLPPSLSRSLFLLLCSQISHHAVLQTRCGVTSACPPCNLLKLWPLHTHTHTDAQKHTNKQEDDAKPASHSLQR